MTFTLEELPPVIRIGAHDVAMRIREQIKNEDDEPYWGSYISRECAIELAEQQVSSTYAVETLLHEILHALCDAWGAGLEDEAEEHIVGVLSTGLTQVLRDNPVIGQWLIRTLQK